LNRQQIFWSWREELNLQPAVYKMKEREGIELTGEPWEDAPLNPSLQGIYLQQLQAQQVAEQQQAGGAPGHPGDQPPGDPGSDQGQGEEHAD
jgi:hypothetical protein